jgi:probable rRNA maturation factor
VEYSRRLSGPERQLAKDADIPGLLAGAVRDLGLVGSSLSCRMSTPAELLRLNRRFADLDEVTDVLAFPAGESLPGSGFQMPPGQACLLGDLVISVGTASAQAEELGHDPRGEVRLLAVHGLLHLLGHDHHQAGEAERMTAATRQLLARDAARRGLLPPRVPALLPPA